MFLLRNPARNSAGTPELKPHRRTDTEPQVGQCVSDHPAASQGDPELDSCRSQESKGSGDLGKGDVGTNPLGMETDEGFDFFLRATSKCNSVYCACVISSKNT